MTESGTGFSSIGESTEYFRLLRIYRNRKQFLGLKGRYKFDKATKAQLLILSRTDRVVFVSGSNCVVSG